MRAIASLRITAMGIVVTTMLLVIVLSGFIIAAEANHDCAGAGCPICQQIQQCENTLRQIGGGCVVILAMALVSLVPCLQRPFFSVFLSKETPVSLKVRMNM